MVIEPGVSTAWARYMFYYCTNLVTADLSGLDTSNVTSFHSMFDGCKKLETADLSGFRFSGIPAAAASENMFQGCAARSMRRTAFAIQRAALLGWGA